MAPVLQAVLAALLAAFTKKNLTSGSTAAATVPAAIAAYSATASGIVPPDNLEAAITQIVGGLLAVVLFYLKPKEK